MAGEEPHAANGRPTWRDLETHIQQARAEQRTECRHIEQRIDTLSNKLEEVRRHEVESAAGTHAAIIARIDDVEAVIDQQRGARSLVYGLIGSNILLVMVSVLTILHLTGII